MINSVNSDHVNEIFHFCKQFSLNQNPFTMKSVYFHHLLPVCVFASLSRRTSTPRRVYLSSKTWFYLCRMLAAGRSLSLFAVMAPTHSCWVSHMFRLPHIGVKCWIRNENEPEYESSCPQSPPAQWKSIRICTRNKCCKILRKAYYLLSSHTT